MSGFVWSEKERKRAEIDFARLLERNVDRSGALDLLDWLEETDFYIAPAGAKHHGAYRGGLLKHSLNVLYELRGDSSVERIEDESKTVCALLHDVCKIGVYHLGEDGTYTFRDPFPLGHGEKSVFLVSNFMRLTREEALAIRWHMGAYDDAVRGGSQSLNAAMEFSPLVYALHAADMRATLREKQEEQNVNQT